MLNHWLDSHPRDSKGPLFHIGLGCDDADEFDNPLSGVKIDRYWEGIQMTQGKARDKGVHEAKVFEDVLSLCLLSGGEQAKAARKLEGDADSSAESPDIRVNIAKRDTIVGIEHFRVDQNIKGGKKAESKDLEASSRMNKQRLEVLEMDEGPDQDAAMLDTVGRAAANYIQHSLDAGPGDLAKSLEARLYGTGRGHACKLGTYRQNLSNTSASKIEIGFLIEIHSDFSGYFINDEQGIRKVERGQAVLPPETFDLLKRVSKDVDWLLLGFYPNVAGEIVDAKIVDCREGRFSISCREQKLMEVELLRIEGARKRKIKYGHCSLKEDSDQAQIWFYRNDDPIQPFDLAKQCVSKTAKALNLAKCRKPFAATAPIQALYETVQFANGKDRGEFSESAVLRLLQEMPPDEARRRYADFGKRYGIASEGNSAID